MPVTGLSFAFGDGRVRLESDGSVIEVSVPGVAAPVLQAAGLGEVVTEDGPADLRLVEVTTDVDEVASRLRSVDGRLEARVRQSFVEGWTQRIVLTNHGGTPLVLQRVISRFRPGPDTVAWGLAAGVGAGVALLPLGDGPVLGGRVVGGEATTMARTGMGTGPVELAPGGRLAVQWRLAWYPTPVAFAATLSRSVPPTLCLEVGDELFLSSGEDTAVVAGDGVVASSSGSRVTVFGAEAGRANVELRSARGTLRLTTGWAAPLDDLVARRAGQVLAGSVGSRGRLRLESSADALVLQRALGSGLVPERGTVVDGLELYCGRLSEADQLDPFAVALLVEEYFRTGEADLITPAAERWPASVDARPGWGLAALRLSLALLSRGAPVGPLTAALLQVRPDQGPALTAVATRVELGLVLRSAGAELPRQVRADLLALGAHLGAGLPGEPLDLPDASASAHASAVLGHAAELGDQPWRRHWGMAPSQLAARAEVAVRVALGMDQTPGSDALAWLLLARSAP